MNWNDPKSIIAAVQPYGWRDDTRYWLEPGCTAPLVARATVWGVTETYQVWSEADLEYYGFLGSEPPPAEHGCEHPLHAWSCLETRLCRLDWRDLKTLAKAMGLATHRTVKSESRAVLRAVRSTKDYGLIKMYAEAVGIWHLLND